MSIRNWIAFGLLACFLIGCGVTQKMQQQADAHYYLGISHLRENDPTRALKEFMLAAEANPKSSDIQAVLAQAYHLKKAYQDAEEHYLRALELSPASPQIENNLAALYLDMERWNDAIRYFRSASSDLTFTGQSVALTGLGFAQFQKGDYLESVAACQKAIEINPRYSQAHLRLGEAYYALDQTELAIKSFEEALAVAPNYALAHYKLGLARMKQGDADLARKAFAEVVRLAPSSEIGGLAIDYLKLLK